MGNNIEITNAINNIAVDNVAMETSAGVRQFDKILNPPFNTYPEIRWWLAEGYHTDETLENAVQKLHDMGFSGCEVLTLTDQTIDRQLYGWGSEEFYHDMLTIAKKATELGMGFSFTSGPDWQPAVPGLDINSQAATRELDFTNLNLTAGQHFSGELKPYAYVRLGYPAMDGEEGLKRNNHAVFPQASDIISDYLYTLAVRLKNPEDLEKVDLNCQRPVIPMFGGMPVEAPETVWYDSVNSVIDLTFLVKKEDGKYYLDWTAPSDGNYAVITFWSHSCAQIAASAVEAAYCVNHMDQRGPQALIEYWEKYFLTPEMKEVIRRNGNVDFFMDSLEITTTMSNALWWCEDFPAQFEKRRGYSLIPYLPILAHYNNRVGAANFKELRDLPRFNFADDPSSYKRLLDDVHMVQTDLYRENYLQPLRRWLNANGINLRSQASYGSAAVAFEMTLQGDSLDLQETETFEMADMVDNYRTHSGVSHLYRMGRYSCEMGATAGKSYCLSLKEYLRKIHRTFAGGVNRVIMHGYSTISGPDQMSKWPGYEGIGFMFTDRWGERHPYGEMAGGFTGYIARLQAALRVGQAKMDVGILNLMFHSPDASIMGAPEEVNRQLLNWQDFSLAEAGYTYDFFAPQYLERDFAFENKTFDAGNSDYRALIAWQPRFPLASAKILLEMARQGMPVVIVDGAGTMGLGLAESAEEVAAVFDEIKKLPNAACCQLGECADALKKLGLLPRTAFAEPVSFYAITRESADEKYLFLMNAGEDAQTDLSVEGLYTPYLIDCWTGKVSDALSYRHYGGRTIMSVAIADGDAKLFALLPAKDEIHITASDAVVCGKCEIMESVSGTYAAALSDGTAKAVSLSVPEISQISEWQLEVSDWQKGPRKHITETRMGHTTTEYYDKTKINLISLTLQELKPWSEIPEIGREVSGTGTYIASFDLPENWKPTGDTGTDFNPVSSCDEERNGLLLDLGTIFEMAKITVNGQFVQYVNMRDPKADISAFVHSGSNQIKIEVTTTLENRLISMGRYAPGSPDFVPMGQPHLYKEYGLLQCRLIPYTRVKI